MQSGWASRVSLARMCYCSRTSLPPLYSKRRNRDRNARPRRLSLKAPSGSTSAATSRTSMPPTWTMSSRAGAALTLSLAVLTSADQAGLLARFIVHHTLKLHLQFAV
jgi:hypothetical protein